MLQEAGAHVFERNRLKGKDGVRKSGAQVAEIFAESGDSFTAKVFIDSTGAESLPHFRFVGIRPSHQLVDNSSPGVGLTLTLWSIIGRG
jgi:hypothetical protein